MRVCNRSHLIQWQPCCRGKGSESADVRLEAAREDPTPVGSRLSPASLQLSDSRCRLGTRSSIRSSMHPPGQSLPRGSRGGCRPPPRPRRPRHRLHSQRLLQTPRADQAPLRNNSFEALLNNDIAGARKILESQPQSASHLVGLGIVAFLVSILSREDAELRTVSARIRLLMSGVTSETTGKR